ncbi:MAG TPA: outer membrane lipoprotein carrier protein LolA [Desulfobacter postgatei]|jgi:outer membrane lipoprotein-sorting protein|uniref:outer membrane lipoprotein carrier protein LolA n=1 Tax=Desulfobacter sp. TaxID=2294 RepID=UPI001B6CD30B|nr:outer membrane lipoprotein carrier protein LolA [Desulfobacter sp.]MBP8829938.1 outer membrane lipoprotein carrier protein LolA [Desulfobacter sp.]HRF91529.1 outer membrane lipoprotein carrier protein LolA [Desulfobacter postgatei]
MFIKKRLFLGAATVLMAAVISVGANAASLADIQEAAGTIRSISADFIQEKHMKILVKPLVSKGSIRFQSPDALRFEYREPIKNVLIMQGKSVSRYIQKENTFIRDNASAMGAMTVVMDEISQWLKGDFNTNVFDATIEEAPEPGRIILVPKEKAISSFIQEIVLVLSEQPGVFKEVVIRENQNSYTRLRFEKATLNEDINPDVFSAPK